jgi:hypothetical protein
MFLFNGGVIMKAIRQVLTVSLMVLTMVSLAQATTIWYDDFESGNANNWIEVWGGLPPDHAFIPTASDFVLPLTSPAGGSFALWVQQDDSWAARSGGTIAANTEYTLSAAIGRRLADGNPNPGLWHLQLYAGTDTAPVTLLTEIAYNMPGANLPTAGYWAEDSVTFNSTGSSYVGQTLWARLYTDPVLGYDNSHFDNIQLNATLAPEPASLTMLAGLAIIGGLAVPFWSRRRTAVRR